LISQNFIVPIPGNWEISIKIRNSNVPANHCIVGDFESALRLLKKQINLKNPYKLKEAMKLCYTIQRMNISLLPSLELSEIILT